LQGTSRDTGVVARRAASASSARHRPFPPCLAPSPEARARKISNDEDRLCFRAGGSGGWDAEARGGRVGTSVGSRAAYGTSRESAPTRSRLFRAARAPRTRARAGRLVPVSKYRRDGTCLIAASCVSTAESTEARRVERGLNGERERNESCRFSHATRFFSFLFFSFLFFVGRRFSRRTLRDRSHTLHDRS
jgi:hypothetical protein